MHPSPSSVAPSSHSSSSSTVPSPQLATASEEPDASAEFVDEPVVLVPVVSMGGIDVDTTIVVIPVLDGSLASDEMSVSLMPEVLAVLEVAGLPVPSTRVVVQAPIPSSARI